VKHIHLNGQPGGLVAADDRREEDAEARLRLKRGLPVVIIPDDEVPSGHLGRLTSNLLDNAFATAPSFFTLCNTFIQMANPEGWSQPTTVGRRVLKQGGGCQEASLIPADEAQ
jgi:hypothetical protein